MKKSELYSLVKEEITSLLKEEPIKEMAKITGDLQSSIEKVIQANPDLENLPLKKAIKADSNVIAALGDETLFDNQLNKFISLTKGERTLQKRGRKADPNKPAPDPNKPKGQRGRPKLNPDELAKRAAERAKKTILKRDIKLKGKVASTAGDGPEAEDVEDAAGFEKQRMQYVALEKFKKDALDQGLLVRDEDGNLKPQPGYKEAFAAFKSQTL